MVAHVPCAVDRPGSPNYEAGKTSPTVLALLRMTYIYLASTTLHARSNESTAIITSRCERRLWTLRRAIEHDRRFGLLDLHSLMQRGERAEDVSDT